MTSPKIQAICLSRAWGRGPGRRVSGRRIGGPGWKTLNIASCVGVLVIALSRRQSSVEHAGAVEVPLDLEALDGLLGRRVVDTGRHLGQPGQLEQAALQLADLLALVARSQHEAAARLRAPGSRSGRGQPRVGDGVGSAGTGADGVGVGSATAAGRSADRAGPADGGRVRDRDADAVRRPGREQGQDGAVTTTRRR